MNTKKERVKLTPEQLFNVYLECNAPGAPVKTILERYGLRPWDMVAIRKKVKAAALGSPCPSRETGTQTAGYCRRTVLKSVQRTRRNQRRACCRGARTVLVKKKNELGLKGPLNGHFKLEDKRASGYCHKRCCQSRPYPETRLPDFRDCPQETA